VQSDCQPMLLGLVASSTQLANRGWVEAHPFPGLNSSGAARQMERPAVNYVGIWRHSHEPSTRARCPWSAWVWATRSVQDAIDMQELAEP